MSVQYSLNFEKLCSSLKLGQIKGTPEAVTGGLLHRMYFLETTKGKYAVKALNPQVMRRPEALNNLIIRKGLQILQPILSLHFLEKL